MSEQNGGNHHPKGSPLTTPKAPSSEQTVGYHPLMGYDVGVLWRESAPLWVVFPATKLRHRVGSCGIWTPNREEPILRAILSD